MTEPSDGDLEIKLKKLERPGSALKFTFDVSGPEGFEPCEYVLTLTTSAISEVPRRGFRLWPFRSEAVEDRLYHCQDVETDPRFNYVHGETPANDHPLLRKIADHLPDKITGIKIVDSSVKGVSSIPEKRIAFYGIRQVEYDLDEMILHDI